MKNHISLADLSIEKEERAAGHQVICGVDEAGAGPLMGPVYAAAVILPEDCVIAGLDDSKKLTERKREALFPLICEKAVAWSVAFCTEQEIDQINILNARMLAMQRAIDALPVAPDFALIDGNRSAGIITPNRTVIGGDARSLSIAAASVLAKGSRDRFVAEVLDPQYPEYQFAKHKGYGTKLHYEMLNRFGPCPCHRKTFLRKWEERTWARRQEIGAKP